MVSGATLDRSPRAYTDGRQAILWLTTAVTADVLAASDEPAGEAP